MAARVIVVASDSVAATKLVPAVTRLGYEVTAVVFSATDAISAAGEKRPDLILVAVPPNAAEEVAETVRAVRSSVPLPVVYLTGRRELPRLDLVGPFGYVLVPWHADVLRSVIETTLHCHRKERQLEKDNAEMRLATARLAEAQALSHVGSWEAYLATGAVAVSDECLRIHGFAPGSRLADIIVLLQHVSASDRVRLEGLLRRAREEGRPYETEYEVQAPDEPHRVVHQRVAVHRNGSGRPSTLVSTVQDITEQQRTEEALRKSEERAAQLAQERDFILEHTRDVLYYIDRTGSIYYISPAVEQLSGFTPDEWKGPFTYHLIDTPNNRRAIAETEQILRYGREYPPAEIDIRHKDGHVLVAEVVESPIKKNGEVIGLVGVARDITERRQAEHRLRQAAAVFENMLEAVMIADPDHHIAAVNRSFVDVTGYTEAEVRGTSPDLLSAGVEETHFREEVRSVVEQVGRWSGEMWYRRKSGEVFPAWVAMSVIRDDSGQITNYVTLLSDLSRLRASEAKLDQLAHYNPLTRLPNRLLFNVRLAHAMRTAERQGKEIALLFIDLDHFKNINDTLGHPAGDRLLQEVAGRLSAVLRKEDTVAHLGGDEFIVILEDIKDVRYLVEVAQKTLLALAQPYDLNGQEAVVTASMGISIYPRDATDAMRLVQNADTAMYRAKELGRAKFQFYTAELTRNAVERMTVVNALRNAIKRREFVLYYQPQISLKTGSVVGVEALIRWRHPERGLVLPDDFIPIGEETGLITSVGEWVLYTACNQAREWRAAGVKPITMAINLSAYQLIQGKLVERVAAVLRETAISPSQLELEITESAIMRNTQEAARIIRELKSLGVRVAIDDFGTGYSSMSYLKHFAVDKIKIASSFIQDLPSDVSDREIARAIIALGHSLHIKVIAEGVETVEQRVFLRECGCDEMQGFVFSPAIPERECRKMLAS
jgi:diguanylate cyclase (GGDEF)-like protein/PAS domain S-box-containing protein